MRTVILSCLVAVVVFSGQAFAQCTQAGCTVGPCVSFNLLTDPSFENGCTNWKYNSGAQLVRFNNEWSGHLDKNAASGRVYQDFTVSNASYTYSSFEVMFVLEVEKCSVGGETLYVELRRPSDNALLETVAVLPASTTSSGTYEYFVGNYNGQAVRLAFRQVGGTGDTEFRIRNAAFWANL